MELIRHEKSHGFFKENFNELTGECYPTSSFVDYRSDVEVPLPMIYQSGYLTIKDWNMNMVSFGFSE